MKRFAGNILSIILLVVLPVGLIAQSGSKKEEFDHKLQPDSIIAQQTALNFLAVGDWGRNGEDHQKQVAEQMGKAAAKVKASFIISTGDNIYPSGVISEFDPAFKYSFEDIYSAFSLQWDWYLVLGNHDYKTNPDAEVAYSKISRRWKMPARYYAKKFPISNDTTLKVLIVFVDANPFLKEYYQHPEYGPNVRTQDTVAQKKWIEKTLSDTDRNIRWKIVVAHQPLYTGGGRMNSHETLELRGSFKPILDKYHVDVYLSGHEHNLQHIVPPGGTQYFISGGGSEKTPVQLLPESRFAASEYGFMLFSLKKDQLMVQVIDYQG
ncbi:MAG TPA: tartrate-resistant acid phosphatase type 5 family protein, partial [Bacteroidales bacterium]